MTYTNNEKQAIVTVLHQMMIADGYADVTEEMYLRKVKNLLNLPITSPAPAMDMLTATIVIQSMDDDKKMEVAGMLQQMIMADGIRDNDEMFLFGQILQRTGIDKAIERKTTGMNIRHDNASIYCRSSKIALAKRSSEYLSMIDEQAEEFRRYFVFNPKSFEEICEMIVEYSRDAVSHCGWDLNDIDGVSWFIGNFTDAMLKAKAINDYDSAFQRAFTIYFN